MCESITSYDDPNAKASLIFILGEYSKRIEGVEEIICDLMDFDFTADTKNMLGTFLEDPV